MDLSPDFADLLAAFERARVRYLVIGGYAVSVHSRPRFTKTSTSGSETTRPT